MATSWMILSVHAPRVPHPPTPSSMARNTTMYRGGNSKPYVGIDCQWEDIGFRLGALNKLLAICSNLVSYLSGLLKLHLIPRLSLIVTQHSRKY